MNIDYWGNEKPKCPHCAADFDVWGGDNPMNISYEDDGRATIECDRCRKEFICVTTLHYRFSTAISEDAADDDAWGPQTEDAIV